MAFYRHLTPKMGRGKRPDEWRPCEILERAKRVRSVLVTHRTFDDNLPGGYRDDQRPEERTIDGCIVKTSDGRKRFVADYHVRA